jgi:hypothetical protein
MIIAKAELQNRLDLWPIDKVREFATAQEFATAFLASEDADDLHEMSFELVENIALAHFASVGVEETDATIEKLQADRDDRRLVESVSLAAETCNRLQSDVREAQRRATVKPGMAVTEMVLLGILTDVAALCRRLNELEAAVKLERV